MIASQSALFGNLLGTAAMREIFSAPHRLRVMLAVEAALARAEARAGVIPAAAAEAIAAAAADPARFDLEALVGATELVGYPVVALTKQLAELAGAQAGGYVHWGATTQDILDTATALQLRDAFALLEADLLAIVDALAARAAAHRSDPMAGRTHLQHALPITFGYACALWLAPLLRQLDALRAMRTTVAVAQLGGAVGTLASLGTRARQVTLAFAEELGLAAPDAPWHADRSRFAEAACLIGAICGSLAKIATDVALLMQTEIGELAEPYAPGRGGSSTMPQKRNPIACEYALAATRGVHALVPLMLGAMAGDHQRSTGPWQSEEIALPQIVVLASAAFAQTRAIAAGMTVDTARMGANLALSGGAIVAESVSMALAERIGHARAHAAVARACDVARASGTPLLDILAGDATVAAALDRAALARLLDPAASLGEAEAVVDRVVRAASAARRAEVGPGP